MKSTIETTNRAIVWPLFHAYTAPPKLMAMMMVMMAPMLRIAPTMSNSRARLVILVPARGLNDGM